MKFGSVCSGIEAASVAWNPLGWKAQWFSEIAKFPSQMLSYHYPHVPNLGDMTKLAEKEEFKNGSIELLVGGTPCQSFSVAGLRKGLDDPRGNLALVFLQVASRSRPNWVAWENVPGVLSSNGGRDFGAFLGGLVELGYGVCYRVLDAQYFGLAQRRSRVFVVGYLGDWRRAAAVLFERESLSWNSPPSREKREDVAETITPSLARSGGSTAGNNPGIKNAVLTEEVSKCLTSRNDAETETFISHTLTASYDSSPTGDGGFPIVPVGFDAYNQDLSPTINTLRACTGGIADTCVFTPVALAENQRGEVREMDVASSLGGVGGKMGQGYQAVQMKGGVRRLTPREWERLQGFPDDYTLVPYRHGKLAADGPRYTAIGNSMPVNVMRWIGERIQKAEACHDPL